MTVPLFLGAVLCPCLAQFLYKPLRSFFINQGRGIRSVETSIGKWKLLRGGGQ